MYLSIVIAEFVDDADLAGHIQTVSEFMRTNCDVVDGPGKNI